MAKSLHCQQGSTMMVSMATLVILTIFSVALLAAASSTYQLQANNGHKVQALLIAEGGAERIYSLVKTDPAYRTTRDFNVQVGTGTATGTLDRNGGTYTITSTGTSGRRSETVALAVYTGVYEYGLYAKNYIFGEQNNVVRGADVVSGGGIEGISVDPGYGLYPYTPQTFPQFAQADYSHFPSPTISGNTIIVNGINYLEGGIDGGSNNITITCPSGEGALYVKGDLRTKNNLGFYGNLVIVVDGDVEAKNSLTASGKTHLVVKHDIDVKNNMTFHGSVIAEGAFKCKNNLDITYAPVGDALVPGGPGAVGYSLSWLR